MRSRPGPGAAGGEWGSGGGRPYAVLPPAPPGDTGREGPQLRANVGTGPGAEPRRFPGAAAPPVQGPAGPR